MKSPSHRTAFRHCSHNLLIQIFRVVHRLFLRILSFGEDVEAKTLTVQVKLVLAAGILDETGNVPRVLKLTEFNVALRLLNGFSDKLGRARLSLGPDNHGLLFLSRLVDQEGRTLGVLLSNLLSLNSSSELG
jgi:hypothetical protein